MEIYKGDKDGNGCKEEVKFYPDDLSAQSWQVTKVSGVDSVKCVIVHLSWRKRTLKGWLVLGRFPEIVDSASFRKLIKQGLL